MGAALLSFVTAARSMICMISFSLLVFIATMFLINLSTSLLIHHLKFSGSTPEVVLVNSVPSNNQNLDIVRQIYYTDYDSEDNFEPTSARYSMLPDISHDEGRGIPVEADTKYSETNVWHRWNLHNTEVFQWDFYNFVGIINYMWSAAIGWSLLNNDVSSWSIILLMDSHEHGVSRCTPETKFQVSVQVFICFPCILYKIPLLLNFKCEIQNFIKPALLLV